MKKKAVSIILISIMILMLGCRSNEEAEAVALSPEVIVITEESFADLTPMPNTPSPTPEPDGDQGIVLVDNADIVFAFLKAGEKVTITGEQGTYYTATFSETSVLIDKRFVRLASDGSYEVWRGYSRKKANLYDNFYLEGQAINTLTTNTAVTVLADIGFCYRVSVDTILGYMNKEDVSKKKLEVDGGSSDDGSAGGADGGDIVLPSFHGSGVTYSRTTTFFRFEKDAVKYPVAGEILADNVEAYIGFLNRGDTVNVIDEANGFYTVIFSHQLAVMRTQLVRLLTAEEYAIWDGYAKQNAPYFDNYHMVGDPIGNLSVNTILSILCELDYCYIVNLDGAVWFVPKDQISTTKFRSDGNNRDGGDWTDPAL